MYMGLIALGQLPLGLLRLSLASPTAMDRQLALAHVLAGMVGIVCVRAAVRFERLDASTARRIEWVAGGAFVVTQVLVLRALGAL